MNKGVGVYLGTWRRDVFLAMQAEQVWPYLQSGAYVHLDHCRVGKLKQIYFLFIYFFKFIYFF